jgi:hypothetical protein
MGNAVYMSMDIPDAFLAVTVFRLLPFVSSDCLPQVSKILNYLQFTRAKLVAFIIFLCVWTLVIPLVRVCGYRCVLRQILPALFKHRNALVRVARIRPGSVSNITILAAHSTSDLQ